MKWQFIYYSNRVMQDMLSLPRELLAEFYAMKKIMEEKGPNLGMPFTKAMGNGLFEMRLRDKDGVARIFYCTIEQNEIVLLHSFIKKTQKTPNHELQLARKRMKEVKSHD
jgi:phage-related protein